MAYSRRIKVVEDFEETVINKSWKGSMHPDSHAEIEADYKDCKDNLVEYINYLKKTIKRLKGGKK